MQKFDMQPNAHLRPALWDGRLALGKFVLTLSLNRQQEEAPALPENRLETLRRERGLTRQELARQLSLHPSTLAALEDGSYQPSLNLAFRLSRFFAQPVEDIFFATAQQLS